MDMIDILAAKAPETIDFVLNLLSTEDAYYKLLDGKTDSRIFCQDCKYSIDQYAALKEGQKRQRLRYICTLRGRRSSKCGPGDYCSWAKRKEKNYEPKN